MNQKRNQGRRGSQSQNSQTSGQRANVIGTARKYCRALLVNDEAALNQMTLYQGGGNIGGASSNIGALRQTGATSVKDVLVDGKKALALFGKDGSPEIACIGYFHVLGPDQVMGDWKIFRA